MLSHLMKTTVCLLAAALLFSIIPAHAAEGLEPGLTGEYFQMEGSLEDFPTIPATRQPTLKRVDKDINFASTTEAFPGTKLVDNFYVRWTGVIQAPKAGLYK